MSSCLSLKLAVIRPNTLASFFNEISITVLIYCPQSFLFGIDSDMDRHRNVLPELGTHSIFYISTRIDSNMGISLKGLSLPLQNYFCTHVFIVVYRMTNCRLNYPHLTLDCFAIFRILNFGIEFAPISNSQFWKNNEKLSNLYEAL